MLAASRPISAEGMRTVVSAGSTTADWGWPSKPATITSSGMRTPMRFSAVISRMASRSLAQTKASGSAGIF